MRGRTPGRRRGERALRRAEGARRGRPRARRAHRGARASAPLSARAGGGELHGANREQRRRARSTLKRKRAPPRARRSRPRRAQPPTRGFARGSCGHHEATPARGAIDRGDGRAAPSRRIGHGDISPRDRIGRGRTQAPRRHPRAAAPAGARGAHDAPARARSRRRRARARALRSRRRRARFRRARCKRRSRVADDVVRRSAGRESIAWSQRTCDPEGRVGVARGGFASAAAERGGKTAYRGGELPQRGFGLGGGAPPR